MRFIIIFTFQKRLCNLIYCDKMFGEKNYKGATIEVAGSFFFYEIQKDISQNQALSSSSSKHSNKYERSKSSNNWKIMISSINRFNNISVFIQRPKFIAKCIVSTRAHMTTWFLESPSFVSVSSKVTHWCNLFHLCNSKSNIYFAEEKQNVPR